MKNLIILFCLLTLVSCGKDGRNTTTIKEVPGPRVDVPGPTKEVEKPNLAEGFVGNWFETNVEGGETFIGISLTPDGQIEIETTGQMISSVNPSNDSLANHPILSYTNVILQDEKVYNINEINLTVDINNKAALKLYKKKNFKIIDTKDTYYIMKRSKEL